MLGTTVSQRTSRAPQGLPYTSRRRWAGGGIALLAAALWAGPGARAEDFIRGDVNADGYVDIGDLYINPFFSGVGRIECIDAADVNDDGEVNITDAIFLLNFLFLGAAAPPPPGPDAPGADPTEDGLTCARYEPSPPSELMSFSLGFEALVVLEVLPGEPIRGEAVATLESAATNLYGAVGWSVSIGVEGEGLQVASITTEGTAAEPAPSGLVKGGFVWSEVVDPMKDTGSGPQGPGAVLAVFLTFTQHATLPPGETISIARVGLESTYSGPEPGPAGRIFYVDGKQGSGAPVRNAVHCDLTSQVPSLGSADVSLLFIDDLARQRPGDCNQDGHIDISDPICLLSFLFLGQPSQLPCGDGSKEDLANIDLLDSNGDGELDLSDAVGIILFLFVGGPPPEQGLECKRIEGCPDVCQP